MLSGKKTLLLTFITILCMHANAQWQMLNPQTTRRQMLDIYARNSNEIWMACEQGRICRTLNGIEWLNKGEYITNNNLNKIHFRGNTGYIVGNNGTILKSIDNGENWTMLKSPTTNHLNCIYIVNDSTVHIAGNSGTYFVSTNGGNSWQTPLGFPTVNNIVYLKFFNDSSILFIETHSSSFPRKYYTANNWKNHTKSALSQKGSSDIYLGLINGANFTTPEKGIISITYTGNSYMIYTTDGLKYRKLNNINIHAPVKSIEINTTGNFIFVVSDSILFCTVDSSTYSYHSRPFTCSYTNSASLAVQNDTIWAVTDFNNWIWDKNSICFSPDNGNTWQNRTPAINKYVKNTAPLLQMCNFLSDTSVALSLYNGSSNGTIFTRKIHDGQWEAIGANVRDSIGIGMIFTSDNSTGFIRHTTGSGIKGIYRSINNGNTWQHIPSLPNTPIKAVSFYSTNDGFISTKSGVFKTTDRGASFFNISTHSFARIHFFNSTIGYALKDSTNQSALFFSLASSHRNHGTYYPFLYRTFDGGATWDSINYRSQEYGSIFIISKISYTHPSIYDFYFFNPDRGYICTSEGAFFVYNGGTKLSRWLIHTQHNTSYFGNTHYAMYDIKFTNQQHGWALLENSILLKTSNGGKSWYKQRLPSETGDLFGVIPRNNNIALTFNYNSTVMKTINGGTELSRYAPMPSTPSSMVSVIFTGNTMYKVSFVKGNGSKRLVVFSSDSSKLSEFIPINGMEYPKSIWAEWSFEKNLSIRDIDTASGFSNHVMGGHTLKPNTSYYYRIYEYNGSGDSTHYNTTNYCYHSFKTSKGFDVTSVKTDGRCVNDSMTLNIQTDILPDSIDRYTKLPAKYKIFLFDSSGTLGISNPEVSVPVGSPAYTLSVRVPIPTPFYNIAPPYRIRISTLDIIGNPSDTMISIWPRPQAGIQLNDFHAQHKSGNYFMFKSTATQTPQLNGLSAHWYVNNQSRLTADSMLLQMLDTGLHIIKLVATNAGGCKDSITKQVFVYDSIVLYEDSNAACTNNTVILRTNLPSFIQHNWVHSGSDLFSTWSNTLPVTKTGSYSMYIGGPIYVSSNVINVNSLPTIPPIVILSTKGPTSFCPGDSIQLKAQSDISANFHWFRNNTYMQNMNDSIHVNASGNYFFIATTDSFPRCSTQSNAVNITMLSAIPKPNILVVGDYLKSSEISNFYQWYFNDTILPAENNSMMKPTKSGFYKVQIRSSQGCTNTSNPYLHLAAGTGNQDTFLENPVIYPNPFDDQIFIKAADKSIFYVYSSDGKLLHAGTYSQKLSLHTDTWSEGLYIIHMVSPEGRRYSSRVVKHKK